MSKLILLCGKVGSGKSTYAESLKKIHPVMVLSLDEFMLSLYDEYLGDRHAECQGRCRMLILSLARQMLASGVDVALDFGFWTRAEREETRAQFEGAGFPVELHYVRRSPQQIAQSLVRRNQAIDAGQVQAYRIDEAMRARFDSLFEEPAPAEVDVWVGGEGQ